MFFENIEFLGSSLQMEFLFFSLENFTKHAPKGQGVALRPWNNFQNF